MPSSIGHRAGSRHSRPLFTITAIALSAAPLMIGGCVAQDTRSNVAAPPHSGSHPPESAELAPPGKQAENAEKATQEASVYERGQASFYARRFNGQPTASGERFSSERLTAAHRELPLGTRVRVTRVDNGRSVTVRINDRGPYADGRVIDLSRRAAKGLGMIEDGTADVKIQVLEWP